MTGRSVVGCLFKDTRCKPDPTFVKYRFASTLSQYGYPLSARTREPFSNFSVTQGGRKNGKEKERKKKGGAPRAPTKPKGGEARTRGRRGGRRKN